MIPTPIPTPDPAPHTTAPGKLRVAVIIGSTREGRAGDSVGRWSTRQVELRDDLAPTVLDLADYTFPARYPERATPQMADFTGEISRAEAFVIVTPEYNRSFPASLKQAIDYAYDEWQAKPVGFVSYGCRFQGLYAVEALRSVFVELHTVTMRDSVGFDLLTVEDGCEEGFEEGTSGDGFEGDFEDGFEGGERAATTMLDQLSWWGHALREARATRPYVS